MIPYQVCPQPRINILSHGMMYVENAAFTISLDYCPSTIPKKTSTTSTIVQVVTNDITTHHVSFLEESLLFSSLFANHVSAGNVVLHNGPAGSFCADACSIYTILLVSSQVKARERTRTRDIVIAQKDISPSAESFLHDIKT
jgi:hypothetical protein